MWGLWKLCSSENKKAHCYGFVVMHNCDDYGQYCWSATNSKLLLDGIQCLPLRAGSGCAACRSI
jgi:hypothetical protein